MNILVLYNSRAGHTHETADAIAQLARDMDHTVTVKSVVEVHEINVKNADFIFIGTWVHGMILFGVKPAGADLWVPSLPSLADKSVATFCTYAFSPRSSLRQFGRMIEAHGAIVVGQQAFHRNRPTQGVETFVQSMLQSREPALV